MRPTPYTVSLLLVAAALLGLPAQAQYKWKDSRGQVHVSDLPPPRDIPEQNVLQRPRAGTAAANRPVAAATAAPASAASAASAAANGKGPIDPELEARRKRAELEAAARQKAEEARLAAQRSENCQRARQLIAGLESGQRMMRLNDRGERVAMDDAMRAAEANNARRIADADCR